jgi:hypothetical protein
VRYRRTGDSAWKTAKASTSATVTLSKLQAEGRYELQVAALRKLGGKTFEGKYSPMAALTLVTRHAPQITKCAESKVMKDYVNASFAWTSVKGAIGYILVIVDYDGEEYYFGVRGTSVTIYDFERNRCYPVAVCAVFADETISDWSDWRTPDYLLTKPYATGAPQLIQTDSGGLKVRWGPWYQYMKVWRASKPTGKRELVCTTQESEYIDTALHPGIKYYYWLTTVTVSPDGKTNESPFSPMATFTY